MTTTLDAEQIGWPRRAFVRLLILMTIGGVGAGVLAWVVIPPQYRSNAQVFLSSEGRSGGLSSALSAISGGLTGTLTTDPLSNPYLAASLFTSREVVDSLLYTRIERGRVGDVLLGKSMSGPADLAKARTMLERSVSTNVDSRTGAIGLSVVAPTPVLAQRLLVQLIKQVDQLTQRVRRDQARSRREFIQSRVDIAATELRSAEQAQVAFRRSNRMVQAPELALEERRLQRAADLDQELYSGLLRDREQAMQEESRNVSTVVVLNAPDLPWRKSWPSGLLLVLSGLLSGAILTILVTLLAMRRAHLGDWPPVSVRHMLRVAAAGS